MFDLWKKIHNFLHSRTVSPEIDDSSFFNTINQSRSFVTNDMMNHYHLEIIIIGFELIYYSESNRNYFFLLLQIKMKGILKLQQNNP